MKTLRELLELKESRATRLAALLKILNGDGTIAGRELTQAEFDEVNVMRSSADSLEADIRNAEFLERAAKDHATASAAGQAAAASKLAGVPSADDKPEQRASERYSIVRAAQYAADKTKQDAGFEREMHDEASRQAVAIGLPISGKGVLVPSFIQARATAATAADAGNLIGTNQMPTMMGYAPQLFVENMGATVYRNLTGINNIPVADYTAVATFVAEGDNTTAITSNVRRPTLTAKAVHASLTNSWYLKAQAGPESDRILWGTLERAEQNCINTNIIKRANTDSPYGIFDAADIVDVTSANGEDLTRSLLVEMINSPENNNASFDKAGFIISPTVRQFLQSKKVDSGSGQFIMSMDSVDRLLGYPAATTTLMPTNLTKGGASGVLLGLAFGNWDQLVIANWAIRELIVNPYSNNAGVEFKLVSFWDWVFANPKAFAKAYTNLTGTNS